VLNVVKPYEEPGYNKANELVKPDCTEKELNIISFSRHRKNITDEINFIIKKQKRNAGDECLTSTLYLKNYFYPSHTKRMAFTQMFRCFRFTD